MAALSFERVAKRARCTRMRPTFTLTGPGCLRGRSSFCESRICRCRDLVAHARFTESCGGAKVVAQRAAQSLAPPDLACVSHMACLRADESARQPLTNLPSIHVWQAI